MRYSMNKSMPEKQKSKRVLIIEDDQFLVRVYQIKFAKAGLETSIATNAEEIEHALKGNPPSVVLLDLMLSGASGFDVLESIKKKSGWAHVPVVIVSNLSQTEDIERGKQLGAADYIVKANAKISEIVDAIMRYAQ